MSIFNSVCVCFFQYAGKWYALQKKDPEGLFLQDNISAEYTIGDDGAMVASSRGRVTLFGSVFRAYFNMFKVRSKCLIFVLFSIQILGCVR